MTSSAGGCSHLGVRNSAVRRTHALPMRAAGFVGREFAQEGAKFHTGLVADPLTESNNTREYWHLLTSLSDPRYVRGMR